MQPALFKTSTKRRAGAVCAALVVSMAAFLQTVAWQTVQAYSGT